MNRSVGAFFLAAALTLAAKSAAAQPAAILRGQVLEFRSEAPLTSVDIRLLDDRGRRVAGAITDGAGAFRFSVPRAGRYQLQSSSLGYASVTAPAFDLGLGDTIQVILHMAIDAVPLAPLEIVARAKPVHAHSGLNAFAARARRQVGGRFLLRDQIDARSPRNVSDLLSTEGGVLVVGGGVFMNRLRCPPTIYLDGVKLTREPKSSPLAPLEAYELVNLTTPTLVEGVEIYAGPATVPAEFSGSDVGCGVIAIWSRRG